MAKCAEGIQAAHSSQGQKLTHSPGREEKHAEQDTPVHYTHYCQHQPSKAGGAEPHSVPARLADPHLYTRYWMAMAKKSRVLLAPLWNCERTQRRSATVACQGRPCAFP